MPRYLRLLLISLGLLAITACANQQNQDSTSQPAGASTSATSAALPNVMLGIRMAFAGPAISKHLGVHEYNSTLVTYVAPDTPAQKAGLEDWDVITKVNGSSDASPKAIRAILRSSEPGDKIVFHVRRGQESSDITVQLEAADHARMVPLPITPNTSSR